jgi:hypothetical protein
VFTEINRVLTKTEFEITKVICKVIFKVLFEERLDIFVNLIIPELNKTLY